MPEKIVPVNGYWIRQTQDPDFAIFHRHGDPEKDYTNRLYVSEGELWIDHRQLSELAYLLKIERGKFAGLTGAAYDKKRLEIIEELAPNRTKIPEFIITLDPPVYYLDGAAVRKFLDPEFVQGGHWLVYSYIPKDQLWIDATMDFRDWEHVLIHEKTELGLMAQGLIYEEAHKIATRVEKSSRVASGGSYPSFETPGSQSPEELLKLYLDLTK